MDIIFYATSHNMNAALTVKFGDHIPLEAVAGMASCIAAYGNVFPRASNREYSVDVFRMSKLPKLRDQLVKWERYGFLRWSIDSEISNEAPSKGT